MRMRAGRTLGFLFIVGALGPSRAWAGAGDAVAKLSLASQGTTLALEGAVYYLREALDLAVIRRVSVSSASDEGDGPSRFPRLSGDGALAVFTSEAANLVASDANGIEDVFVRDLPGRATEQVSLSTALGVSGGFGRATVSADGRFVAFETGVALVSDDTNLANDVYVADRVTGAVARVSVATDGAEGGHFENSEFPAIGLGGRFVAFTSAAALDPADTNGVVDIYVRDRDLDDDGIFDETAPGAAETLRVSLKTDGSEGNASSGFPALSADGRHVAFESTFPFTSDDANGFLDVFVRELVAGVTVRVSVDAAGAEGAGYSTTPVLSQDGRFVAFGSRAALVPEDTNDTQDVYLRDRDADTDGVFDEPGAVTVRRVSVRSDGAEVAASTLTPRISADGRFVVFDSFGPFVVEDTNGVRDVYLHDVATGMTARVSGGYAGEADGSSAFGALSGDGRSVAFESSAANLVPDDANAVGDVFVAPNPFLE